MNYIYILKRTLCLLIVTTLLSACSDDFLVLPPQNNGTVDQFYSSQTDFETAIAGVYSGFSNAVIGRLNMEEYRADNLTNFQYIYQELATNQFGPDSTSPWWALYVSMVYPANVILEKIDEVEMDAEVKKRIKGEALFFRGYAYYTLNLWFGGVPMITSTLPTADYYTLGRSTEAEIWSLVTSDLTEAVSLLPTSVEIGRVDKYDAGAYLAKASAMNNDWNSALSAIKDVWENSGASLEANWTDLWSLEAEKSSNEYMLSVVLSPAQPNNNWAQQFLYMENTPGLQGNFQYKPGYYESFEDNDLRRDETLGFTPMQIREENRKYDFGYDLSEFRYFGDIVVIRFADVQLLFAEAISIAAGSPQQQSLDLMNETRKRAGLTDLTMADVPNLDSFVEAVLAERRSELAWEGHRYSDLKRHGKLVEKVNAVGPDYNYDDSYNYVPIPQSEIDKVGSDILTQNPGY